MNKKNNLTLKSLLWRNSRKKLIIAVILSIFAGLLYALIIPTVLHGLSNNEIVSIGEIISIPTPMAFFVLIFMVLATKASSVIFVNSLAKTAIAKLRVELSEKINAMDIEKLEQFGLPKLLNVLTEDMNRLTGASLAIPMILVSIVTALGMLVYLAILNIEIFVFTILAIIVGVTLFKYPVNKTKKYYIKSRTLKDNMQEGFKGLVFGAYELKLDKHKATNFLKQEISRPTFESVGLEKKGDVVLHVAGNSSEIFCFFAIGMIVFIQPQSSDIAQQSLYGVVMALLYITGPIVSILGQLQQLKLGEVSLQKVNEVFSLGDIAMSGSEIINKNWSRLTLSNVCYTYKNDNDEFSIRDVNLTLEKGKTYFIIGGNGSGKSTLCKLLSFHYIANRGVFLFDEQRITQENLQSARDNLYVIYSDYHLFTRIYKPLNDDDLELIQKYLRIFKLENKTQLINNEFSTINLSDGQCRRLALIVGLVENKAIYVLDEWAADQDPEFKDLFYKYVLPELKAQGKTVIAITHDDRYFSCCDQVIKMEHGTIVDKLEPTPSFLSSIA